MRCCEGLARKNYVTLWHALLSSRSLTLADRCDPQGRPERACRVAEPSALFSSVRRLDLDPVTQPALASTASSAVPSAASLTELVH